VVPTRILDSHVHLTDAGVLRYRWEHYESVPRVQSFADYSAATSGFPVQSLVFVECTTQADNSVAEAHWVTELVSEGAPVAAIVAQADLRQGLAIKDVLDQLAQVPLVRGVRWVLEPPFETDPDCCIRPDFIAATQLLPQYGFTLDISVKNTELPKMIALAEQCPDVNFVLDHIGKPDIAGGMWEPWHGHITTLAGMDNVVCKISGVPMEAGPGWATETIQRYVDTVADAFGPDRILYGSDWPAQHPVGTFASWTDAAIAIMSTRPADEIDRYFFRNAMAVYKINETASA